jgi:hypothetical protein
MTAKTPELSFFPQKNDGIALFNFLLLGCFGCNATWHEY